MDRFVVACEFVVCAGREWASKLPRILSIAARRLACASPASLSLFCSLGLLGPPSRLKEEGMCRAGWLGLTPRQHLDGALGLQRAHEALREARRSYSIRSELQDTGSVSSWFVSSVQAAGDQ